MHARLLSLALLAVACGGPELTQPTELPVKSYLADTEFTLSFVMTSCSSTCAKYEPATCSLKHEGQELSVDVRVAYENGEGACSLLCGPPVLAHCPAPKLAAGVYTVKSGTFSQEISVLAAGS